MAWPYFYQEYKHCCLNKQKDKGKLNVALSIERSHSAVLNVALSIERSHSAVLNYRFEKYEIRMKT